MEPNVKYNIKKIIKKTLIRANTQPQRAAEQRQESPEEYAQTEVQQGIYDVAARAGNTAKSTARMSYRKFRAMQEKRKNLTLQGSTQSASKLTEKEKVTVPTQTERREMFKKQRFRQKAIAAKTPAPQAPVPSSATPAPPPYRVQMQQRLKLQHLTREAVRRYLQKQTAATAAGNTAPIVTHAPKLPTISNKQATVEAISRGVHYIAAKIKALLAQTVRRTAQSLLALLGAGGVVLLLAMVIGAAAAVIGSPMGILFADESGDPNSIPIAEIVADTNADFGAAINDIVSAHPECSETTITYDYEDGHTWASYWPEVLAVFAVQNNLNNDGDVVVIDEGKKRLIQDIFWAMHEISAEVEEVTTTPEPTEDEPDPEPVTEYILHITVSSKSVDALADLYRFTKTSGTFCTGCYPRKCAPVCWHFAAGLLLLMASCAGRCRVTPIYPATSGKWTPSAMPGIAAQIFPHRREHPSWLPTAARCWSAAGTTATAIRCCWITARACPRGTPT